jgi:S1-C subfamily serine protease
MLWKTALVSLCVLAAAGAGQAANRMEALDAEITALVDRLSESIVSIAAVSGGPGLPAGGPETLRSVGTGIVFEGGGMVVTTASVVGHATRVEVGTAGGGRFLGEVVGTDPSTDLAVIRVDGLEARPAPLSGKREILPGSLVFVVGNSFGQLPSVSMGVISNSPAPLGEDGGEEMLRMSVPVNPGNTGAAIVGAGGEVVGLLVGRLSMSAMPYPMRIREGSVLDFARTMQVSNLSVALPAYRLSTIAREIIEEGSKRPGFLGVRVAETGGPSGVAEASQSGREGVVVTSVVRGSPAESIGLEPGDIIWKFGTSEVASSSSLRNMVSATAPGNVVSVFFVRGDKDMTRSVRIARLSPEQLRGTAFTLRPQEIDIRIKSIEEEIDRLEKELKQLEESR